MTRLLVRAKAFAQLDPLPMIAEQRRGQPRCGRRVTQIDKRRLEATQAGQRIIGGQKRRTNTPGTSPRQRRWSRHQEDRRCPAPARTHPAQPLRCEAGPTLQIVSETCGVSAMRVAWFRQTSPPPVSVRPMSTIVKYKTRRTPDCFAITNSPGFHHCQQCKKHWAPADPGEAISRRKSDLRDL
jgi:hypothetical protein